MCRYVMIKYSHRGLVKGGKVSTMFSLLYHTLVFTFLVIYCVVGFSGYLGKKDPKSQQIIMQVCLNSFAEINTSLNSKKVIIIGITLGSVINALLLISYVASKLYILRSSKDSQTPIKFGRYRRNIFTYTQTMVIGFSSHLFLIIDLSLAIGFNENTFGLFRNLIFWNHILNFTLFTGVLVPLYILWDLYQSKPEFFKKEAENKKTSFYILSPLIIPRRESVSQIQSFHAIRDNESNNQSRVHFGSVNHGVEVESRDSANKIFTIEVCSEPSDNMDRYFKDRKSYSINNPENLETHALPDVE